MSSISLIICILLLVADSLSAKGGNTTLSCFSVERNALLKFKASFSDPSHRLSSWNNTNTDCCKWKGVQCDTVTRNVVSVDLRNEKFDPYNGDSSVNKLFSEALDSSIVKLKRLSFLDLSGNDFRHSYLPAFIGSMNQLQYLNLSHANFSGLIPHQLGSLSQLSVLDLGHNGYYSLIVDDLTWVSRLSSLTHLDMSLINLTSTKDLLKVFNMLPSIVSLSLQDCGLESRNLQIQYLDSNYNSSRGELPCFLENMMSLRDLDLSFNSFQCSVDKIFEFIQNNCNLKSLDLGFNSLIGDISNLFRPNSSKCFDPKLAKLVLYGNHFYGQLSEEVVAGFKKLEYLDLGRNSISGLIPASISNWSALTTLRLNENKLNGSIPSCFGNLTSLKYLDLRHNQLSGEIPTSLGQLKNLEALSIDGNYFHGIICESHLANLSNLQQLYIGNGLTKLRVRSDWTPSFRLRYLWIESCEIEGGLFPKWLQTQKELISLHMPNCRISGTIPDWLLYRNLTTLDLSDNHINEFLPESLCHMFSLGFLDLSKNRMSGDLPECLFNLTQLFSLNLFSNQFSGVIPNSIGRAYSLAWLRLSDNNFTGEFPSSIRNCTRLIFLDVGHNNLSGRLPKLIGKYLLNLEGLRLTHNEFHDTIPFELCHLSALKILDLANNKLTGNIPRCFDNFSKMVTGDHERWYYGRFSMQAVMKGTEREYFETMRYLLTIDLSNNNLVGEIPLELTRLVALTSLNLSHNRLLGTIPGKIGEMKLLESLDLSDNNLFGNIPMSLSNLDFLGFLNFSHNNLSGEIPTGGHLQTLDDPWRYEGNPGLCGASLLQKCNGDKARRTPSAVFSQTDEEEYKADRIWFCGVVIGGFATGFWGVIGVLMFKLDWRFAYFKFADDAIERVFGR